MWSQGELYLGIAELLDQFLNRLFGTGQPLVHFRPGGLVLDDQVGRLFKGGNERRIGFWIRVVELARAPDHIEGGLAAENVVAADYRVQSRLRLLLVEERWRGEMRGDRAAAGNQRSHRIGVGH